MYASLFAGAHTWDCVTPSNSLSNPYTSILFAIVASFNLICSSIAPAMFEPTTNTGFWKNNPF